MKCNDSCYYYDLHVGSCDYFLVTKKRRDCDPENCTRYTPRSDMRKRRDEIALIGGRVFYSQQNNMKKAMRILYDQGLNDKQIGEKIGRSKASVFQWRRREKLPPNGAAGRKKKEESK